MADTAKADDLPRDNAARLAIYDAMSEWLTATDATEISIDELFEHVIGRLRVLVPRELHLAGERAYLRQKIDACIEAGMVYRRSGDDGAIFLALSGSPPHVRYPDGHIRDYSAGLELARERLERDNARLRAVEFDVRNSVPSTSDNPNGAEFQALLSSMREHGYMKQFPLVRYDDGVVVDGRARQLAAAILQLEVEYLKYGSDRDRTAAKRRDTPLNRVLVALHSNEGRLPTDIVDGALKHVAEVVGRGWDEIAADLALTEAWRQSIPAEYSPWFDVTRYAFRDSDEPRVQATSDHKVMLRSLVEAAGLSNYKIDMLRDYVPFERARSAFSAGRKAVFAQADHLITGIAGMQAERQAARLKLDPEWDQIREWLIRTFESEGN